MKSNLLDTPTEIDKRIFRINNFDYQKYAALAKTEIYEENSNFIYKQELFKLKKIEKLRKEDFVDVADALDYLNSTGFIHGDLNKKNIIYTSDGFKVIDFEPSLFQIKNGINQLMVTLPYVLDSDLKNNHITETTDKLGFIYFILRVTKQMVSSDVIKLCKSLDHENYLNIKLNEIKKMSYRKFIKRFFNKL